MNFDLTEEQKTIIDAAREICEAEFAPKADEIDKTGIFPKENLEILAKYDLSGIPIPEEYGGLGADFMTWALVGEEIAQACSTTSAIFGANILCIYPIYMFGTEEQKQKYLVPLAKGQKLGAFALTEPSAGSDASGGIAVAVKDGNEYVLNGSKMFITNADSADIYVVTFKTQPARGARGMSAFIVEKGTPGFIFGKQEEKMCYHALPNCGLTFQDCRVPVDNLLSQENRGFRVAMETLDVGRVGMAVGAIGLAKAALKKAIKYAKERIQFGQPISSFQAIQHKIADMATEIEAAELLMLKAVWLKDQNRPFSSIAAMAKLYASEVCARVTNQAVQIHGGYGLVREYTVERYLRESKLFEIVEGTSEIQRSVIAGHVLK
ncbi:MAG: butyryl-CoA dehydrogenase [Candidatus Poribacteria bacterium]|nr:butyryl-CoA dehydrogenase [Candidatus Poribacteria bacterium]